MRRRGMIGVVLTVAVAAGWGAGTAGAQAPPAAKPTPPPAVEAVAGTVEAFMEALNTADIARFAPLFTDDATMFFPLAPLYTRLENKEQIVKVFTLFFESVRKGKPGPTYMNLAAQDLRIQLHGSVAVATFHFRGPDQISRRTLVLVHQGKKWLIVHMHASGIAVTKE